MFEHLAPFTKIIVTGPQRSGTTLVAVAIAEDLAYWFYPEEQIRVRELWRVDRLFRRTDEFVLQAPAICRWVHRYSAPEVAVVMVRRPVADIVASEERVAWTGQAYELSRYGLREGVISEVKYEYWDQYQKHAILNPVEVEYESLKGHPLWVDKNDRKEWHPRQYGHTSGCGEKYQLHSEQVQLADG